MLWRLSAGDIPRKHHIAHRDGQGALRFEECFTRDGFEGAYSILYHEKRPHAQRIKNPEAAWHLPSAAALRPLAKRHYRSQDVKHAPGALLAARLPLLFNDDVVLSVAKPNQDHDGYFANGDADELYFVLEGGGMVRSAYGDLRFGNEDYFCIPRGVLHRIILDPGVKQEWLIVECQGALGLLKQWRNECGQLRMDAPYCHRDFRTPHFVGPMDENIRTLTVKKQNSFHGFSYEHSPLDVVGWDGAVYPWAFNILNFQPRAGLVHLPPTWHGTFATRGALICSFVPRVVDFHPEAIPCPYPHSSVDCDEFLFYCRGNFTSRKGVERGSISHHPAGIPHGPHPGAYEKSIGSSRTEELAVMLDTYKPLYPTPAALGLEDPNYQDSFI